MPKIRIMYRTANNIEDLDLEEELNSYSSVGHAVGRSAFWNIEEKYHNADFFIYMIDDSEEEEIRQLLTDCGGYSAWLEYEIENGIEMTRIN